jgi:hypothetical protein
MLQATLNGTPMVGQLLALGAVMGLVLIGPYKSKISISSNSKSSMTEELTAPSQARTAAMPVATTVKSFESIFSLIRTFQTTKSV